MYAFYACLMCVSVTFLCVFDMCRVSVDIESSLFLLSACTFCGMGCCLICDA